MSQDYTEGASGTESGVTLEEELKEPAMYRVLLHNDDYTTMDFVVKILEEVFHKSQQESVTIMMAVHEKGMGVCGVYPREIAEFPAHSRKRNAVFKLLRRKRFAPPVYARQPVETATIEGIAALFKNDKLRPTFDEIVKKAQAAARVRIAARQAKEVARAKNSIENLTLVGKLAACTGKKPELNELFIVEGDSAGGTAKQARIRQTQAILPLRGKPLNVEKKRIDQVLANEEIRTIISALGAGYGSDFDMEELKFHKVIILSDADQDGMHIRCILLTFFFRYMRELINNGNVYIGMPPLYKVYKKDVVEYAYDDAELQKKIEIVGKGYQIQRYKGLGEMSAEQLWETTMDPARRNLIQVNIEDAAEAEQMVTALMGDRVEARKEFLARNANFNKVDTFIDRVNI